jgi:hypothetical protein
MMVAVDAEAQKSIKLAKEKKARMANTAQIARWYEKYSRHSLLYIYTQSPTTWWVPQFRMIRYSSEGKVFFGPSAKGLRSNRSLNLLQRNKLPLRGATVEGLPLPKVLKTCLTICFQHDIDYYRELRLKDGSFLPWQKAYDMKM